MHCGKLLEPADGADEGVGFFLAGGPAGAETNDVAAIVGGGVVFKDEGFGKTFLFFWCEDDELLVGSAVVIEWNSLARERVMNFHGHGVGAFADAVVFAVGK